MGIYAPHIKPYPALTIVPTADACPSVERKKFTHEDRAVPNIVSRNTSKSISSTSPAVINQPTAAR